MAPRIPRHPPPPPAAPLFAEGEGWALYHGDALAVLPSLKGVNAFAGSGTTGVAALLSGRRFVGIERCLEHCEVAARRLAEASGDFRPSTTPQLHLGVA